MNIKFTILSLHDVPWHRIPDFRDLQFFLTVTEDYVVSNIWKIQLYSFSYDWKKLYISFKIVWILKHCKDHLQIMLFSVFKVRFFKFSNHQKAFSNSHFWTVARLKVAKSSLSSLHRSLYIGNLFSLFLYTSDGGDPLGQTD